MWLWLISVRETQSVAIASAQRYLSLPTTCNLLLSIDDKTVGRQDTKQLKVFFSCFISEFYFAVGLLVNIFTFQIFSDAFREDDVYLALRNLKETFNDVFFQLNTFQAKCLFWPLIMYETWDQGFLYFFSICVSLHLLCAIRYDLSAGSLVSMIYIVAHINAVAASVTLKHLDCSIGNWGVIFA